MAVTFWHIKSASGFILHGNEVIHKHIRERIKKGGTTTLMQIFETVQWS